MSERVLVRIGNVKIPVATDLDPSSVERIARKLTEKLKEIEDASGRIDTTLFALQAAFSYAEELHHLQREAEEEAKALIVALDRLTSRLEELTIEPTQGNEV